MNSHEIKLFLLENGLDINVAEKFEEEEIDQASFLKLTSPNLKEMKLTIGARMKIIALKTTLIGDDNIEREMQNGNGESSTRKKYPANRDLSAVLKGSIEGEHLLKKIIDNDILSEKELNLFNQIVVEDLSTNCEIYKYPSAAEKQALAKAISTQFQTIIFKNNPEAVSETEKFFYTIDSSTKKSFGKIEWRMMYLQKKLPVELKKNIFTPRRKLNFSIDDIVSLAPEFGDSKERMIGFLVNSFEIRSQMRKANVSAREMLSKFPQLMEGNGEMIDHEFNLMKLATEQNIDQIIPEFARKIINKFNFYNHIDDDFLKILIIIKIHVSTRSVIKTGGVIANNDLQPYFDQLFHWEKFEDDVDSIKEKLKDNVQPYIIFQTNDINNFASLIIDGATVILGHVSYSRAFDLLIKTFYIFNLKYEKKYSKIFQFFEYYVYKILAGGRPSSAVMKFYNFISN